MVKMLKFLMAALLVSFSATAVAQCLPEQGPGPPRLWNSQFRCYMPAANFVSPGFGGVVGGIPVLTGAPVGGGIGTCTTVGALAGGTLGSLNRAHPIQATILAAIAGGTVGNLLCRNDAGQAVPYQQYQQGVGQGYGNVNQQPRTVRVPSDCDIDGRPDLQDLKGLTEAQCAAVAGLAAKRGYSQQVADRPVESPKIPSDGAIRACMWKESPNSSTVIAVSVPDPNNPQWKVVPSEPGETCQAWKDRISKMI